MQGKSMMNRGKELQKRRQQCNKDHEESAESNFQQKKKKRNAFYHSLAFPSLKNESKHYATHPITLVASRTSLNHHHQIHDGTKSSHSPTKEVFSKSPSVPIKREERPYKSLFINQSNSSIHEIFEGSYCNNMEDEPSDSICSSITSDPMLRSPGSSFSSYRRKSKMQCNTLPTSINTIVTKISPLRESTVDEISLTGSARQVLKSSSILRQRLNQTYPVFPTVHGNYTRERHIKSTTFQTIENCLRSQNTAQEETADSDSIIDQDVHMSDLPSQPRSYAPGKVTNYASGDVLDGLDILNDECNDFFLRSPTESANYYTSPSTTLSDDNDGDEFLFESGTKSFSPLYDYQDYDDSRMITTTPEADNTNQFVTSPPLLRLKRRG